MVTLLVNEFSVSITDNLRYIMKLKLSDRLLRELVVTFLKFLLRNGVVYTLEGFLYLFLETTC